MDYEYKDQHFSVEIAETLLAGVQTSGSKIANIKKYLVKEHLKSGGLGLPDSVDEEFVEIEEMDIVITALLNETKVWTIL